MLDGFLRGLFHPTSHFWMILVDAQAKFRWEEAELIVGYWNALAVYGGVSCPFSHLKYVSSGPINPRWLMMSHRGFYSPNFCWGLLGIIIIQ